jgi:hypothetical protein
VGIARSGDVVAGTLGAVTFGVFALLWMRELVVRPVYALDRLSRDPAARPGIAERGLYGPPPA